MTSTKSFIYTRTIFILALFIFVNATNLYNNQSDDSPEVCDAKAIETRANCKQNDHNMQTEINHSATNSSSSYLPLVITSSPNQTHFLPRSESFSSSSSSWFRTTNFTFFPHAAHTSSTKQLIKNKFGIDFSHGYLVITNAIREAIKPFLLWLRQNSIKLLKHTVVLIKDSHIYLCTLLTEIKCEYVKQSDRLDLFLQTLDNHTSDPSSQYYSPLTMSTTNWMSPEDILIMASNSMKQDKDTTGDSFAFSGQPSPSNKPSSVLPDLSSKLNSKAQRLKSAVGNSYRQSTERVERNDTNTTDAIDSSGFGASKSSSANQSHRNATNDTKSPTLDCDQTNRQTIFQYISYYAIPLSVHIYTHYITPTIASFKTVWAAIGVHIEIFPSKDIMYDDLAITSLGPSLLLSLLFVAFVASLLQFNTQSTSQPSTARSRAASVTTTVSSDRSSSDNSRMFNFIVFIIKLSLLLVAVLFLYSYLIAVESISRHRLTHRVRIQAVNDYILHPPSPSPTERSGSHHTRGSEANGDYDSTSRSSSSSSLRSDTLNLQWVNTAVNAFWLIGSDGGLGPYISETVEKVLNSELALVPPGIANLRLSRFSFGMDPPVVRALRAHYDIRNKSHCTSLGHTNYAHTPSPTTAPELWKQNEDSESKNSQNQECIKKSQSVDESVSDKVSHKNGPTASKDPGPAGASCTDSDTISTTGAPPSAIKDQNPNGTQQLNDSATAAIASGIWDDIMKAMREKLSISNVNSSFPFPHYKYDQPHPQRYGMAYGRSSKRKSRRHAYHYKRVRSDELIRGCQLLSASIDFGYVSKDLDIVFALRPNDAKVLYPEINVALTEFSFAGSLRVEVELIPEYPFLGNATVSRCSLALFKFSCIIDVIVILLCLLGLRQIILMFVIEYVSQVFVCRGACGGHDNKRLRRRGPVLATGSVQPRQYLGALAPASGTNAHINPFRIHKILVSFFVLISSIPCTYGLSQYTHPNVGHIDLKPLLCPSCVPPLKKPLSFQFKMFETLTLLTNRSADLATKINSKTAVYSQKIRSLVRQGLMRMELDKKMRKTARFILDRKEALAKEFDSSSLLNCIE